MKEDVVFNLLFSYILMVVYVLKLIIQGFIVGIGKIIPGVSGSMMAIFMGIYEPIIEAIVHFFDDKKRHFKLLFGFGIGFFLAITLFSRVILFLLEHYYNIVIYLFLGLILGATLKFRKKIIFKKKEVILFIGVFFLFLTISLFPHSTVYVFKNNLLHYLYVIILGSIDAISSIVPGISGTAIFMMLGSYEFVLHILANPFSFLFLIYLLGVVKGAIGISYLMIYLFRKWKNEVYTIIFALSIGSFLLLFLTVESSFNLYLLFIMILGIILGTFFDK